MSNGKQKTSPAHAPARKAGRPAHQTGIVTSRPLPKATTVPAAQKSKAATQALKVVARAVPKKKAPAPKKRTAAPQGQLKLVDRKASAKVAVKTLPRMAAPKPVHDKVRIFQIYYRPEQRQYLDPAFEPYNNQGDNSPLLEFNVFRKLMNSELVKGAELWGALSWKFGEKTGLNGAQLRDVLAKNPGCDVYYCNPYPELEGLYHNLWLQGETAHPNFLILCRDFFQASGLDANALEELQPSGLFAASNYFVATPAFWWRYLKFVEITVTRAEQNMSDTAKAMIYSSAADKRGLHAGANYLPFIIERLFGYFLVRHAQGLKTYRYAMSVGEARHNVHSRLLTQLKDVAVQCQSLWLGTCWINYRNLYLAQTHRPDWLKSHLRSITPTTLILQPQKP